MYKLVIFNFDGVIADTYDVLKRVYDKMKNDYRFKNMSDEEIGHLRELSMFQLMKAFHVPFYRLPRFLQEVIPIYKDLIVTAPLFDGIRETVKKIKDQGSDVVILSSNNPKLIRKFLKHHDFEVFDKVVGGAAFFNKQTRLNSVIRLYKVDHIEAIYIADERRDIEACKKINLPIAAVTWGYDDYKVLGAGRPTYLVQDIEDLEEALLKNPST